MKIVHFVLFIYWISQSEKKSFKTWGLGQKMHPSVHQSLNECIEIILQCTKFLERQMYIFLIPFLLTIFKEKAYYNIVQHLIIYTSTNSKQNKNFDKSLYI